MTKIQIQAAQAAMDKHDAVMRLEPDTGHAVQLWHLIYSLIEWCDANAVDFDATVSNVRDDMR